MDKRMPSQSSPALETVTKIQKKIDLLSEINYIYWSHKKNHITRAWTRYLAYKSARRTEQMSQRWQLLQWKIWRSNWLKQRSLREVIYTVAKDKLSADVPFVYVTKNFGRKIQTVLHSLSYKFLYCHSISLLHVRWKQREGNSRETIRNNQLQQP